ncbi:hypothetical protein ACWEKT_37740 [Nocardia takedensis]
MTTPTPRPNGPRPGAPVPGPPLPGRPLPGPHGHAEPADPAAVRAEIDALLAELATRPAWGAGQTAESGADLTRRAHILEQAHEVLVRALATVDKI